MNRSIFLRLILLLTVASLFVAPVQAIVWCHDYTMWRVAGCDPRTPKVQGERGNGLSFTDLCRRLEALGFRYFIISGNDLYSNPDYFQRFLKPGDVIILGPNHSGIVNSAGRIDHFLQDPRYTGYMYDVRIGLPRAPLPGTTGAIGGLFLNDTLRQFIYRPSRPSPVELRVYRRAGGMPANYTQIACPELTSLTANWETLTVPNTAPFRKVRTSFSTIPGAVYMIEASGVISDWGDKKDGVDAVWCYAEWRCGKTGEVWDQLRINGKGMSELAGRKLDYNAAHLYRIEVTGNGGPIEFHMADAEWSAEGNSGAIQVRVARIR